MRSGRDGVALGHLRTLLDGGWVGHLSDAQLIERFLARSGEAAETAFAALVERRGPVVLRVCRSVLADAEAAQDAFQATFLVLVRKAGSVRVRDSLGPWLVAVAYRTAASARSASARRRAVERDAAVAEARPPTETIGDDLAAAVRSEVDRLADRYRRPILLCYFAGLTHEGAARQLGCPVGTVRSRMAWGRKQLRERLIRRGLAPSTALTALAAAPTRAGVPTTLLLTTARAAARLAAGDKAAAGAAALADRIVRAMLMTKLKGIAAAVLTLALAATGGGVLAQQKENPGSAYAEKKASLGLPTDPRAQGEPVENRRFREWVEPKPAAPKVRADVEIEMLLRAAREQEQAGHHDQALALTTRMDEALRTWRADLQRRQEAATAVAGAKLSSALRTAEADLGRERVIMQGAPDAAPIDLGRQLLTPARRGTGGRPFPRHQDNRVSQCGAMDSASAEKKESRRLRRPHSAPD